jgi:hypothetical protein
MGIGKKIDAKITVKELKAGFKDMKRENGLGSRKIRKDEKKELRRKRSVGREGA